MPSPKLSLSLRPDVLIEPLVDQWYAWSHLIPPATTALHVTARHLKIMDSFVAAPQIHRAACRDPELLGGPFLDLADERVAEVHALAAQTRERRRESIRLAYAIKQLDDMLRETADGRSLEPLYALVPDALKGYVELVYDLGSRPSFRLLEPLLYRSPFYQPECQTVLLSPSAAQVRPFVFSTPRLPGEKDVHLQLAFDDPRLDALARLRAEPAAEAEIRDALELDEETFACLSPLLTAAEPALPRTRCVDALRCRYLGHACVLLEAGGYSVLVDPVLPPASASEGGRPARQDLPERIDLVLLTHGHQDHLVLETLLELRHRISTVVVPRSGGGSLQDPSLELCLRAIGFRDVVALDVMQPLAVPGGEIVPLPFLGEHADLDVRAKCGYLCRLGGTSAAFLADSNCLEPAMYAHVVRDLGRVDYVFIGMECEGGPLSWLYGALLTQPIRHGADVSRRLSASDARAALAVCERLRPREVFVYAMGQEPWLTHVSSKRYTPTSKPILESDDFVSGCRSRGIAARRLLGGCELFSR